MSSSEGGDEIAAAVFFGITGGAFLLGGLALSKSEEWITETPVHRAPQFGNFIALSDYLRQCPGREANVLVQGRAEKLDNRTVSSLNTGIEGAARISVTVTQERAYSGSLLQTWYSRARTENYEGSVPFTLAGTQRSYIRVQSIHTAEHFQELVTPDFKQEKALPGLFSDTPPTSDTTVPTRTSIHESIMVFNTEFASYGSAVYDATREEVTFTPEIVGLSISRMLGNGRFRVLGWMLRCASTVCYIFGGISYACVCAIVLQD